MSDVFVSYNREDLPIAQRVVDGLVHEGVSVWLDMELKAGENYDEITEQRLHSAKAVVVLWSSRSVKSRWVRAEATIGQRKKTLIPAMIEECDRPVMFELVQSIDLSKWEGDRADPNWRRFIDVIQKMIAAAPPGPLFATSGVKRPDGKRKAAPKQVAIRKEHVAPKKKSGMGPLGALAASLLTAMLLVAGVYVWRPAEVNELIGSLSGKRENAPVQAAALEETYSAPALTAAVSAETIAAADMPDALEPAKSVADTPPASAAEPEGTFRECDACPLMLNVMGGTFMMGAPDDELGRKAWEGPQRKVAMAPFAISVTEVRFDEWDACVADGGCGKYTPKDGGAGRGELPVVQVSWKDATAYAAWLTKKTGRVYRLPTEAEWEYAGRAGSVTPFWWGPLNDVTKSGTAVATQGVDTLTANGLGLKGMTGNVREWVQDCYVNTFANAPLDGRSVEVAKCEQRVVRGGAFNDLVESLRIAARVKRAPALRDDLTGFRIAAAP